MELKELRTHSSERLEQAAAELRAKIRDMRFTIGTRQRTDVRSIRHAKKELAQLLTVLRSTKQS
jgi:ribosomal protein L29